jgi:hypothetical protein
MRIKAILFAFALSALCFLIACTVKLPTLSDPESSQEYSRDVVGRLENETWLIQTLTARRTPINGITLWLRPAQAPSGSLTIRLYAASDRTTPLAETTIAQQSITQGGPTLLELKPDRPYPPGNTYEIYLQASGAPLEVLGRGEDAYPAGRLYQATGQGLLPLEADLAFRLTYAYDLSAAAGDLGRAIPHLWLIFPFAALLILPGWLLLEMSGQGSHFDAGEQVALSVGLSLALLPLILLWSSVVGLRWNAAMLLGALGLMGVMAAWRMKARWQAARWQVSVATVALAGVFGLSLWVRLVMVRDLTAPAWVDSVHHAAITRLILSQGQFPATYSPFIEIDAHKYHAGYHAGLAAFSVLSRLDVAKAMLIYSQVQNALVVFALYALAKFFTGDWRAGVVAGLIGGLLTPMPAYYTSWGRYTQLAGLLILPAVVIGFQTLVTRPALPDLPPLHEERQTRQQPGWWILFALAAGGMFLIHYRVAAFSGLLLFALFLFQLRWQRAWNVDLLRRTLGWGLAGGGLALLLSLPWTWATLTGVFAPIVAAGGQRGQLFADFSWSYLTAALGKTTLALAVVGLVAGVLRQQRWAVALLAWVGLLLLMANLGPLGVPGAAVFSNNTSVTIIFFIPIAILGGYAFSQAYTLGKTGVSILLTLLLIGLAWAGATQLPPILRASTLLFRQPDHAALAWASQNIPPDEVVLINPFSWGYNLYAGSDGGFWLTSLAERPTMPPPVLYGLGQREEILRINAVCQQVIAQGGDAAALWGILQAENIRYVYVGVRGGPISPAALHASPLFETLYQQDGTWFFRAVAKP